MVVVFYRTTKDGSQEVARIVDGQGPKAYMDLLLSDGKDMEAAMRDAPRRFNGSYLRAELFDTKQSPEPTPTGHALPPLEGQPEITPEQVAEALRDWDKKAPRGWQGLLLTEKAEGG